MSDFESRVQKGLEKCGVNLKQLCADGANLGLAVSGGADSVSLLLALAALCKETKLLLKVITVNHFIRPKAESSGDADYVRLLCEELKNQGYNISFSLYELKEGQVAALAEEKGLGLEAAARLLRYEAFEKFIQAEKLSYLCLAHNKNDQLETILMRFIQGSGVDSGSGIPCCRGKYVRPLLWTERSHIEDYLIQKGMEWRTDSTNEDASYLRNRIRKELVPLLNSRFAGWDKAALQGAQKAFDDSKILKGQAEAFIKKHSTIKEKQEIKLDLEFYKLERGLKIRVLLMAVNLLGSQVRVPYVFLLDICDYADNIIEENAEKNTGGRGQKSFADLTFLVKKEGLLIKKSAQAQKEKVFSAIIKGSGIYEIPGGQVFLPDIFDFPLLLRSWRSDDKVKSADGTYKKVRDLLSDWHVEQELLQFIPVVQALNDAEQRILAVLGSCIGYKDWIVKNEKM